ncbi:acyl carrier protein [Rhodococcus sp. 27YEA15]|uniref:acyl carrier protein n=1 Tax=Rhodococcus sp. 27YEA15 TaxID=3156259 RepID=UPI003C79AE0E
MTEYQRTAASAVADRTRVLIARMAPETPSSVADDQRLVEDLGFDSIRLMELVMALETSFALTPLNQEQLVEVLRVNDVIDLIAGHVTEAGGRE